MRSLLPLLFVCSFLWSEGASSLRGATPYPMGWKPTKHGVKGLPLDTHPSFRAAKLPSSASVAEWYFVTNQGDHGACVAFSAWEAFSAVNFKNRGAGVSLSALDLYQQCLVLDRNFPDDSGTYGSTAIKVLTKKGAVTEASWPYHMPLNMLAPVNQRIQEERDKYRAVKAYAISSYDGGFAVKQCLANLRIGVMVGSYWYNNGFSTARVQCKTADLKGNRVTVLRHILPMPKGSPVGGHEVVIIAYDDNMRFPDGNTGGVLIHNHWGRWGDETGSAWAPYKWFFNPKYAEDKVAIETVK